jgi:chemotaxis methyl-accepting protein methylase
MLLAEPSMAWLGRNGRLAHGAARCVQAVWQALPASVLATPLLRCCGAWIHQHYTRHQDRQQTHFTRFLRNRPQLEVLASLLARQETPAPLAVASIGCSTGAELYSALWVLRTALPGVPIAGVGVDISPAAVRAARAARYPAHAPALRAHADYVGEPEVKGLSPGLLDAFFVEDAGAFVVRDWLREGTAWRVGDVRDPTVIAGLGTHDVVIANNFLGVMEDAEAEACLRHLVLLVNPNGYLVVEGIDLDLKCRVLGALGLSPVTDALEAVYLADYWKLGWPWLRWANEPLDRQRPDALVRYSTIFKFGSSGMA